MGEIQRYIPENIQILDETFCAVEAVLSAGEVIRNQVGGKVLQKEGMSNVVTEADKASGVAIRRVLGKFFKDEPVLSEDPPEDQPVIENPLSLPRLWVVDDLDGSKNFADGIDNVWVSIAFLENGQPIVGVTYNPILDRMYLAQRGAGAYYIGTAYGLDEWVKRKLKVSNQTDLSNSTIETSISYSPDKTIDHQIIKTTLLLRGFTPRFREIGSSVEQLCRVAAGISDLHFHSSLSPWDFAAGILVIEEAGGVCKGLDGSGFNLLRGDNVSGNPKLVQTFLEAIKDIDKDPSLVEELMKRFKSFKVR